MRNKGKIQIRHWAFFALIVLLSSCFEPQEGCLDINATNFEPSADENCCCILPNYKVQMAHRVGEEIFNLDSTYLNNLGQEFIIRNVQFYLSNFKLLDENNEALEANQKLNAVWMENANLRQDSIKDDIILVNRPFFERILGTSSEVKDFQGVEFCYGLKDTANCVIADSISSTHPLGPKTDSLYIYPDGKYHFAILELEDGNGNSYDLELGSNGLDIIFLDYFYSPNRGEEASIRLITDYSMWLEGVNFLTMTKEQIADKIVLNIPSSFRIFE